jgi:hypothetical protein
LAIDSGYYQRTNLIEKMLDDRMHVKFNENGVTMKARELENIRRSKFRDGYDPYNTTPVWAAWLKVAKPSLRV